MKKTIASIVAFMGLIMISGEPAPGEQVETWVFLVSKLAGMAFFTGGLYFAGAFRKEFYRQRTETQRKIKL